MTDKKGKNTLARRDLFRAAGLGAGAIGAAAVGFGAAAGDAKAEPTNTSQRYRETDHVLKAYDASRF